ncbi:subtilisin-like protein [Lactarius quietus]|nr:subtilisin-like protein [Lactarius quietus]
MRYYWLSLLPVLASILLGDLATPLSTLWDDKRVMHTWTVTPANWVPLGHPPTGTTIDLHIALKPQHENALMDALYQVSTPGHPKYGAYLSREQVAGLVAPHLDTLELVSAWLEYHGISSSSVSKTHGGGWLTVTNVPVFQADDLLGASYQLYRHNGTNETVVILRTVGYSLPAVLHDHVQAVAPTTYFDSPRLLQQTPRKQSSENSAAMENTTSGETVALLLRSDNDFIKPEVLRSLYNVPAYVPAAVNKNVIGVLGLKGSYPSPADLAMFMEAFRTDAIDAKFAFEQINNGGYNPSEPHTEANDNIQYTAAITYLTPQIFYSVGGKLKWLGSEVDNEPEAGDAYLEWLKYLLSKKKIPQTINISYGSSELGIPQGYAVSLCKLFMQLGARGVSVLVASGDDGVGRGNCKDESGHVWFNIQFPASCPWVTSVGGTAGIEDEVAAGISQGGFSYFFPRPSYQDTAVPAYLENLGDKYFGHYNHEGRGGPDISAQAINYLMVNGGGYFALDGTSCAAPTVAGIISLLNDYRLSQGKPALGFLNPWLYDLGLVGLKDITSGFNPGCNTIGFSAAVGWDPITGLGTPNFKVLQTNLPPTTTSSLLPSSILTPASGPPLTTSPSGPSGPD